MEHCVFCTFLSSGTTYKDCGRPCETHVVHLRDRVGQLHRLQADVGCRNTLFNGKAQTGARYYEHLRSAGLSRFRVELLDEAEDAGKPSAPIRTCSAGDPTPSSCSTRSRPSKNSASPKAPWPSFNYFTHPASSGQRHK